MQRQELAGTRSRGLPDTVPARIEAGRWRGNAHRGRRDGATPLWCGRKPPPPSAKSAGSRGRCRRMRCIRPRTRYSLCGSRYPRAYPLDPPSHVLTKRGGAGRLLPLVLIKLAHTYNEVRQRIGGNAEPPSAEMVAQKVKALLDSAYRLPGRIREIFGGSILLRSMRTTDSSQVLMPLTL